MKKPLLLITFLLSFNALAATEAEFQQCVQIKDVIATVAAQADKGITRPELKARLSSRAMDELIDWVYDFRGTYSNQQLAKKQMDICLQHFDIGKKRR